MNLFLREFSKRKVDKLCQWVAWKLPRRIAMWTYVRVAASATVGKYENTIVPELTVLEALQRWK